MGGCKTRQITYPPKASAERSGEAKGCGYACGTASVITTYRACPFLYVAYSTLPYLSFCVPECWSSCPNFNRTECTLQDIISCPSSHSLIWTGVPGDPPLCTYCMEIACSSIEQAISAYWLCRSIP